MAAEFDNYIGRITYKDIEFTFVFDKKMLTLVPPKEKNHEVFMWFMTEITKGAYTFGNPVHIEDDYLIGTCSKNGQTIVFFPNPGSIGHSNSTLYVYIDAYIVFKYGHGYVERLSFSSDEIDCIFSTTKGIKSITWSGNGEFTIDTHDFSKTTSKKQHFSVDGKKVSVYFGITRNTSNKVWEPPLTLKSNMFFEFAKTNDYSFILQMCYIARSFVQYLCYRKNVSIPDINLSVTNESGLYETFATMYLADRIDDSEKEVLQKQRYIKQDYISGSEGKILNDIAKGKIYLRHIPKSYSEGLSIDASRFVMLTAAFEWTFNKNHPDGIKKHSKTLAAEQNAATSLQSLINQSHGKEKDIYKYLRKLIGNNNLQSKILQTKMDYFNIIDVFGQQLYTINHETLDYNKMGTRLAGQRNDFAHGNLDNEINALSVLDLMFLERIIYAMQLKEYDVDDLSIKRAINDLFGCHIAIEE